jgi:hypothetical protein
MHPSARLACQSTHVCCCLAPNHNPYQSRWRGYITRKKLREGPDAFLQAQHTRAEAADADARRRAALSAELQRRQQRAGDAGGGGGVAGGGGAATLRVGGAGASLHEGGGRGGWAAPAGDGGGLVRAALFGTQGTGTGAGRCALVGALSMGAVSRWGIPPSAGHVISLVPCIFATPCGPACHVLLSLWRLPWSVRHPGSAATRGRRAGVGADAEQASPAPSADCNSDESAGWSDVELDDVAAIKLRAATPPWQRLPAAAAQPGGRQRTAGVLCSGSSGGARGVRVRGASGGALRPGSRGGGGGQAVAAQAGSYLLLGGAHLPSDAPALRLQQLRRRRWARPPEHTGGSAGEVSEIEGAGQVPCITPEGPLPRGVVDRLMLPRYAEKYEKLGLPDKAPGRWRLRQLLEAGSLGVALERPGGRQEPQQRAGDRQQQVPGEARGATPAADAAVGEGGAVAAASGVPGKSALLAA